jgi:hypothetical protein
MERNWMRALLPAIFLVAFATGCCRLPVYTPAFWNDGGTVQFNNNCYNYGNNKRTDTFAQPGEASGIILTQAQMQCNPVKNAAIADGLIPLPASGQCPKDSLGEECKVALVVDPGTDYHWYRRDQNGMWTHKPGGGRATNLDNSLNPISNPETANRCGGWLCYTDFCGYMCSCSSDVEGQGHEKIK